MDTAKLFENGRSQAVRLPKAYRLPGKEVRIWRDGSRIVLEPLPERWDSLLAALEEFSDDFLSEGRQQPLMQEREGL